MQKRRRRQKGQGEAGTELREESGTRWEKESTSVELCCGGGTEAEADAAVGVGSTAVGGGGRRPGSWGGKGKGAGAAAGKRVGVSVEGGVGLKEAEP